MPRTGTRPTTDRVRESLFNVLTARLELSGLPFVFFVDRHTDVGCVLYIRYDGHYGLITPSR